MKNKDYYFRHDYNPTNDPKIICLLGNYGGLGYGIFWRIVEMLHQEKDYKLPLKKYIFEAIAKQMLTNAEQIETIIQECINTYELFATDSNFFWSNRVLDNINKQQEISNVRSLAGRAGAIAKQNQAKQAKERKGKERKYNTADKSAETFNSNAYIEKMLLNKQKHIRIIGKYFKSRKNDFPSYFAIKAEIKRWLRSARELSEYTDEQIDKSYGYVSEKFKEEWNLSTVCKYIQRTN